MLVFVHGGAVRLRQQTGSRKRAQVKSSRRPSTASILLMEICHCCYFGAGRNVAPHARDSGHQNRVHAESGRTDDHRSQSFSGCRHRNHVDGRPHAGRGADRLSDAADPSDRRIRRRRADRRAGAHHRGRAERKVGPAGRGREPNRGFGQHRHPVGRARAQRRLYHPDGRQQQRRQREPVQEPVVQVRRRSRSGRPARGGADRAGGAPLARGQIGQGPDRPRQVQARRDHVRDRGQRNDHAPGRRIVQPDGRRRSSRPCPTRAAARPPGTCCRARSR